MVQININEKIVAEAYEWLGTRYTHQASLKGAGTDCIGLIIGVIKQLGYKLPSRFVMPKYTPYWAEETKRSLLVEYCHKYLQLVDIDDRIPGDILLYRMSVNAPTKHSAILISPTRIIHSYSNKGVIKTPLLHGKTIKLTHVFRFVGDAEWQLKD